VNAGVAAIDQRACGARDFVLGIAASGTTPFVRAALSRAQTIGAKTGLLSCSDPPRCSSRRATSSFSEGRARSPDGVDAHEGGYRHEAGPQHALDCRDDPVGRAYGNLMVDLNGDERQAAGPRGAHRDGVRGRGSWRARRAIAAAGGSVKLAIVMAKRGVGKPRPSASWRRRADSVRRAVGDPLP